MALPGASALLDALLGKPSCPPSCTECWERYKAASGLMERMLGVPLDNYTSHAQPAPSGTASTPHCNSKTANKIEEYDSDEMPGLEDIDDDPPEPPAPPKTTKPAPAPRPPPPVDDDDMPPLVDIDDDGDWADDKGAQSDESMPSLVSMEDSDGEAPSRTKKQTSQTKTSVKSNKSKDDDSFEALMKRSGTLKRLSDIAANEERVKRDGGAGAEAKLKSLRAERERLEASLAPGGAKSTKAASNTSHTSPPAAKKEQAKPTKAPDDDFDDMPPLEDIDDEPQAPPPKPNGAPNGGKKGDDSFDALMERSRRIKRLAEIKEEEEKVDRAGGTGAEARKTKLRAEREQLERELSPDAAIKPKARSKKEEKNTEVDDFDDMPPLEDLEDDYVHPPPPPTARKPTLTPPPAKKPTPAATPKPKPGPPKIQKVETPPAPAPPRVKTPPPPPRPKTPKPVERPPTPLPPDAKPFDRLPRVPPPTYCLPHRCTGIFADEQAFKRLDSLLLDIIRAKFLLLLANEWLPSLLHDLQAHVLELVLKRTKSLDASLPASRTLISSTIDQALGAARLKLPTLQVSLGRLRLIEALHDTRCAVNLAMLDRRALSPSADLLDCRSTCPCELSTACDSLQQLVTPLTAEVAKRSSHGIVAQSFDVVQWETWCAREVLSGTLKRGCWRGKWESKIKVFFKAFQKAWNGVLASLDAQAFVGGWVDLLEWLGGLRLWQEMESVDFATVEQSIEGVMRWSELLVEAAEARKEGVLLDRRWSDRLKLDGDVDFTLENNSKAVEKYDLANLGDGLNIAGRTNSGLARLKIGSDENFRRAIVDCTVALDSQPDNTKALHRRGYAFSKLGLLSLAEKDLTRCLALDATHYPAEDELEEVRKRM